MRGILSVFLAFWLSGCGAFDFSKNKYGVQPDTPNDPGQNLPGQEDPTPDPPGGNPPSDPVRDLAFLAYDNTLALYEVDTHSGQLSEVSTLDVGAEISDIETKYLNHCLYVASSRASTLWSYQVNPFDGSLVPVDRMTGFKTLGSLSSHRNLTLIYVPEVLRNAVNVIHTDPSCQMDLIQQFDTNLLGPTHVTIDTSYRHAIVANSRANLASVFEIRPRGDLRFVESETNGNYALAGTTKMSMVLGRQFYINTAATDNLIIVSELDSQTGALTLSKAAASGGLFPTDIESIGKFFVTTNQNSNTLSVFEVDDTTGDISFAMGSPISVSVTKPNQIDFHRNQTFFGGFGGEAHALGIVSGLGSGTFEVIKFNISTGQVSAIQTIRPGQQSPAKKAIAAKFMKSL